MTITDFADSPVEASVAFHRVSFPPSPLPLRLSSSFAEPDRPIAPVRRQLAWVSLQSRLVGAPEATSSRAVGKGLGPAEAAAWELFTPLHRVLLVALVAIASAESRRSRRILQLQRSVDIRDEVLKNMQIKLDDLFEQLRSIKDHSSISGRNFPFDNEQIIVAEMQEKNGAKFFHCGCGVSHLNPDNGIVSLFSNQSFDTNDVYTIEPSKEKLFENNCEIVSEQEERRMSDLSDFCCSVASSVDIQPAQLSTLAAEQELYNLRMECKEKDATIKELSTASHASTVTYSKRITELEEVIRRKNMIMTKLKKDMSVLEQQIVKFTRLRRPSYSFSSSSDPVTQRPPLMTENILYDMSSTSPSSSDCDSPQRDGVIPSCISTNEILLPSVKHRRQDITKAMGSSLSKEQRAMIPLKENRVSRKVEANAPVRTRQLVSSIKDQKSRR